MKGNSGIPLWILGLIIVASILIGKDFFPLLNITLSTSMFYTFFLIGFILIAIDFIDIFKSKDEIEKFFQKVGMNEATKIRKEIKPQGYESILSCSSAKAFPISANNKKH